MKDANHIGELIESNRQDAKAQQAKIDAQLNQGSAPPRTKQILFTILLAVAITVLVYQAPRFSEPLTWPDPATRAYRTAGWRLF